jgi:hypothetical protein
MDIKQLYNWFLTIMSYRLEERSGYAIMAQVVMGMLMEGNQILESFAKRVAIWSSCLISFRGKIHFISL